MNPSIYGPYPYVPITERKKFQWPNGARLALWVVPNIEFFHLDDPIPGNSNERIARAHARIPSVRNWVLRDYGNRVGIWRFSANGFLRWLLFTVAGLMILAGAAAGQQPYPNKPIRFIVPYAPGGSSDLLARLIGPKFTESWGQPVIVDNRPGGNTMIGTQALTRAAPDGYTILMMAIAHTIIPNLLPTPYDPIKDFAPVATVGRGELVLVLHPSVPANNMQELIALARSKPGQLNYASASTGGPLHLAGELFNMLAGVKTQHIPYKGSGPAITDLLGGHVQMMFSPPSDSISHLKSGKLKAIAVSGNTRLPPLPQVPTFAEAGMPGFTAKNWFGVLAPAGTPKPIIDKLSAEIARILALPDVREKLLAHGVDPYISTPGEFAALLKSDLALYGKIIKSANIKLE